MNYTFDALRCFEAPSRAGSCTAALKMVAKRYTTGSSRTDKHGLTLLFVHCVGSRTLHLHHLKNAELIDIAASDKEQCETKKSSLRIREAWAFDLQNHGDSAILNTAS